MLIEPQFTSAITDKIWSLEARFMRMAWFEAALATAQAQVGLIPQSAANSIAETCAIDFADPRVIFADAHISGNPAIPLIKVLTQEVSVKDSNAARFVHFGSTSQDVIDTALMLGLAECADAQDATLSQIIVCLTTLAEAHINTPMVGRTLLQQATPITFGLKAALWLVSLVEARNILREVREKYMAIQLAGPVGSLSGMGDKGADIRKLMAKELRLQDPECSWQSNRGRILHIASAFAGSVAASSKVAGDVILLMQSEIGEVFEAEEQGGIPGDARQSKGGSSAMPHKRNPVDALVPVSVLPIVAGLNASIVQTQNQQNERAAGNWHSEWIIFPLLTSLAQRSSEALLSVITGLQVNVERCSKNMSLFKGLLASEQLVSELANHMERNLAHKLIETLVATANGDFEQAVRLDLKISGLITSEKLNTIFSYHYPIKAAANEATHILKRVANLKGT